MRAISVSGRVTLNGADLASEAASRGQLVFTSVKEGTTTPVFIGATGLGAYAVRLPPGSYDVAYWPNPDLCTAASPPGVPCGGGALRSGVALTADGVLISTSRRSR